MSWEKRPARERHAPAFRPPRLNSRKKRRNRVRAEAIAAALTEEQRRSFAFGNATISNPSVTRELIDEVAEAL